jgi:hypothetical protein
MENELNVVNLPSTPSTNQNEIIISTVFISFPDIEEYMEFQDLY